MAQLPLKFSTNPAASPISPHSTPRPSTDGTFSLSSSTRRRSSSIDKEAIRSILLRLFRPPKGNCGASPLSSRRFKLIACFSSAKHPPPTVESDGPPPPQIKRDSITSSSDPASSVHVQASSEDESSASRRDSRDDTSCDGSEIKGMDVGEDEEIKCEDSGNVGNLEEISSDLANSSIVLDYISQDNAMDVDDGHAKGLKMVVLKHSSSVKKDQQNLAISPAPGVVLFVAKLLKAMKHSGGRLSMSLSKKNSKRKGDAVFASGKPKSKRKSRGSSNRYQIWTKPIMMGKRCRKLDDGFPYGDDDGVIAAETMAVDDHPRVSATLV